MKSNWSSNRLVFNEDSLCIGIVSIVCVLFVWFTLRGFIPLMALLDIFTEWKEEEPAGRCSFSSCPGPCWFSFLLLFLMSLTFSKMCMWYTLANSLANKMPRTLFPFRSNLVAMWLKEKREKDEQQRATTTDQNYNTPRTSGSMYKCPSRWARRSCMHLPRLTWMETPW